ncbi:MAG: hypothetical protein M1823_000770 [Watsoniomyces obsoletus]|nr:MAG: hypothetical protein M1823_000770 [Watsoniomyces obsoletus]
MADSRPMSPEELRYQEGLRDEDRGPTTLIIDSTLIAVAVVVVALRFIARAMTSAGFKSDDYTIVAAMILAGGVFATQIVAVGHGLGKHNWAVTSDDISIYFKTALAEQSVLCLALAVTRISILLLYRRLFVLPSFHRNVLYVGIFVVCLGVSTFLAVLMSCMPIRYFTPDPSNPHCINLAALLMSVTALNFVTDVVILVLPMPQVWRLQTTRQRKVVLTIVFCLGGLACVTSLVRIYLLIELGSPDHDHLWLNVDFNTWSNVEPCVGIYCACLPVMAPLFRKFLVNPITATVRSVPGSKSATRQSKLGWGSSVRPVPEGTEANGSFSRLDPSPNFQKGPSHTNEVVGGERAASEDDEWVPMEGIRVKSDVEWVSTKQ